MYAIGGSSESVRYKEYMSTDLNQSQSSISSLLNDGGGFSELLNGGGGGPYDVDELDPTAVKKEQRGGERDMYYEEEEEEEEEGKVQVQGKISGLARQSSSAPGFFSNLVALQNGFTVMGNLGNFRDNNGMDGKHSAPTRLKDHIHISSSSYMPQIAENRNESNNQENGFYIPSFENDSWDESSISGLKRSREGEEKLCGFNAILNQNGNDTSYPSRLTHHLSLPKTSGEMASVEKYLQFQQDVVPCKVRAKRGFATHPRSIAERMRRTRISDRMKKLQDLFPDMDKQTNTADMLDLAVEYIKNLQNQVQALTGKKANCTCIK